MKAFLKKFLNLLRSGYQTDFPTRFSRIAVIGIITLPLIYSVLYLWAFWDPYKKVDSLPVAFVILDKGGFEVKEKKYIYRNVGLDLAAELVKKDTLKFTFTTLDDAMSGLENKKYYAYFVIPENFTANIISVNNDTPQQAKIEVKIREAISVVVSKIIDRVASGISESLSYKISQEYFNNIFLQSRDTVENLKKAVDGANKLNDGIASAKNGSQDLVNGINDAFAGSKDLIYGLDSAASGGKTIQSGLEDAGSGADTLENGLKKLSNGAQTLTTNLKSAQTGAVQIRDGARTASAGASNLSTYTQQAASGARQLSSGLDTSLNGAGSLSAGLSGLSTGLTSLGAGVQGVSAYANGINQGAQASLALAGGAQAEMQQLMQTYPDLANDQTAQDLLTNLANLSAAQTSVSDAATNLSGVASQMQAGMTNASGGIAQLTAGASALQGGLTQLKSGADNLAGSLDQISAGQQQLGSGLEAIKTGSTSLASGLASLSAGSAELAGGLEDAHAGSSDLANGLGKLSDGQATLVAGLTSLDNGGAKLSTGLGDLKAGGKKLSDGLETASSGTSELYQKLQVGYNDSKDQVDKAKTDQEAPVLANPVQMDEQYVDPVKTYGTGFSPYFIPLSMWVGAIAIFVVFGTISTAEARKYKRFHLLLEMLRRYAVYMIFGAIQAIVLGLVLTRTLGLEPNHTLQFYEFMIVMSFLFIAIMMFLNYAFGGGGPFVAVILLMLQLTSSGGTYPVETTPQFFQDIAPYLPMTYAVNTLRDLISGSTAQMDGVIQLFIVATVILFLSSVLVKKALAWLSGPKNTPKPKTGQPSRPSTLQPALQGFSQKISGIGARLEHTGLWIKFSHRN